VPARADENAPSAATVGDSFEAAERMAPLTDHRFTKSDKHYYLFTPFTDDAMDPAGP
jgi:hypothetical protein